MDEPDCLTGPCPERVCDQHGTEFAANAFRSNRKQRRLSASLSPILSGSTESRPPTRSAQSAVDLSGGGLASRRPTPNMLPLARRRASGWALPGSENRGTSWRKLLGPRETSPFLVVQLSRIPIFCVSDSSAEVSGTWPLGCLAPPWVVHCTARATGDRNRESVYVELY